MGFAYIIKDESSDDSNELAKANITKELNGSC